MEAANLSPDASPEHASPSEASMSSGYYPSPPLSPGSSDSGSHYFWMLDRPHLLGPQPPAPSHESASASAHPSSSRPPEIPHSKLQGFALEDIPSSPGSPPERWIELLGMLTPEPEPDPQPPVPVFPLARPPVPVPPPAHPLVPVSRLPHPSSPGSSVIPPSRQLMWSDQPPTGTNSPPHGLTPSLEPISVGSVPLHNPILEELAPSHHSASDSIPSLESISGGSESLHNPIPEGLAPLHHPTPDGSTPSHSPLPTETPPDNGEFFNNNVIKKVGIVAGAIIVGGTLAAGIVSSQKHHKHRDCQDS